jgi:CBS domain-containing protein
MSIATLCVRNVDLAKPNESAWQAAVRMRQRAVGTLVIVNSKKEPIGIVTDRDLMERVMAAAKDPGKTPLRDVMTPEPMTLVEDASVGAALAVMSEGGFRRLPVVNQQGILVGLLSLDDLIMKWADEISQIGRLVRRETPQGVAAEQAESRWE